MAAPWASESAPIPARSYALTAATLSPCKLGAICVLSRELVLSSSAADVVEQLLREDASAGVDAAYLSADDGTTPGHHRGLLAGLVAGAGSASMSDDLAKLAAAVMAGGSGGDVLFVCLARSLRVGSRAHRHVSRRQRYRYCPAWRCRPIASCAWMLQSLVHATSGDVEITGAVDAVLHWTTNPVNIGSAGARPSSARLVCPFSRAPKWARGCWLISRSRCRRSGAVAYADGCSW